MNNPTIFYKLLYRTLNIVTLPVALTCALFTRFGLNLEPNNHAGFDELIAYGLLAWLAATSMMKYYYASWHSRAVKTIYRTTIVSLLFFSFVGVFSFLFKDAAFSRIVIALFALYQWMFVLITHHVVRMYMTHQNSLFHRTRNILIVGEESSTLPIITEVELHDNWDATIIGYINDTPGTATHLPHLGTTDEIRDIIIKRRVQELLITYSLETHREEIKKVVDIAENEGIRVQIIPQNLNRFEVPLKIAYFGSVLTYRVRHIPLDDLYNRFLKRSCDLICSIIGITLLSPILIPVILAIKLADGGPILFVQKRTGLKQGDFNCLKFRSMTTKDLGIDSTTQPDGTDPRLLKLKVGPLPAFPLGTFLRKSNIDELPQLFNVIRGEMSLVGPRPHMIEHTEQFRERVESYMLRHFVRPGITGLAQVNGYRGKTDTKEKLEGRVHYDLKYIENWSLPMDIKILFATVFSSKAKERDL